MPLKPTSFRQAAERFVANLTSLRTLSTAVAKLVDDHDRERVRRLAFEAFCAIGVDAIEAEARSHDLSHRVVADSADEFAWDGVLHDLIAAQAAKWPEKYFEFEQTLLRVERGRSNHGELLRRGSLTLLASFLEILIGDLVQAYYLAFPQALPSESQSLSLAELRRLESLSDAELHVAGREAQKVVRMAFRDQVAFFTKRLKFDADGLPGYNAVIEALHRRNAVVHSDGVVDQTYLKRLGADGSATNGLSEGQVVVVSDQYLRDVVDTSFLFGLGLLQLTWRRWGDDLRAADWFAQKILQRLLRDQRYDSALHLATFVSSLAFSSDAHRQQMLLDQATALRDLGRSTEARTLLATVNWAASSLRLQTLSAALEGDFDRLLELLPRAISAGELYRWEILRLPAFTPLFERHEFREFVATCPLGGSSA